MQQHGANVRPIVGVGAIEIDCNDVVTPKDRESPRREVPSF